MKKCWANGICFALALSIMLAGCQGKDNGQAGDPSGSPAYDAYFLSDSYDGEIAWHDNSLDAYSAKFNMSVKAQEMEGYKESTTGVIGQTSATFFRYYWGDEDPNLVYQEIVTVDEEGKGNERQLVLPFDPQAQRQAFCMGEVWGSDHLMWTIYQKTEDEKWEYHFWETDENLKVIWDFYSDFLNEGEWEVTTNLIKDRNGNIHLMTLNQKSRKVAYYVTNEAGSLLATFPLEDRSDCWYSMIMGFEGEVFLVKHLYDGKGTNSEDLVRKNWETGEEEVVIRRESIYGDIGRFYRPWHSGKIIYVNNSGVFCCDETWGNQETLYLWTNHGITANSASVYPRQNGEIGVLYYEGDDERFVLLAPTTEEVEIKQITLAVAPHRVMRYSAAVTNFNKKYPAYHIELKSDYDETRLLTELVSGGGPVLIDSCLTGFENQQKLWEPLDGMLEATGLKDELIGKALELGKINGVTYGIPSDFSIRSVVILDPDIKSEQWNYEYFLKAAEKKGIKAVFPPVQGNIGGRSLLFSYLMHGMEDNYLLDAGNKKSPVNTSNLERALGLADSRCVDEGYGLDWAKAFQEGEVLCVPVGIRDVSGITHVREHYGDHLNWIGYPTKDGGRHFLEASYPTCIRTTATAEEKRIAYTFLREMLSYDGQKNMALFDYNFGISVRKDVFEEQIRRSTESVLEQAGWAGEEGLEKLRKELEADESFYRELVNEAKPAALLPVELENIMWDEFTEYFSGTITRDMLKDHLRSRVKLFLDETK
ncbi:MAG: ABC transporter substrate-binding protein [Acetatifactor sp.]|nr:ABC transporter substrate-binding protein [Acetatifactor sp.]